MGCAPSFEPPERGQNNPNRPQYPIGVPSKFDPDGNVQRFPGNTIVAHLPADSRLYASMLQLYAKLEASPLSKLFALLPPSSWHMTVFEGVCDSVRGDGYWPHDIPRDASLEECTAVFTEKLRKFNLGDESSPPYRLKVVGFSSFWVGIGVSLQLATDEEDRRFRGLRDRLSGTLLVRHPQHDHYELHLSMAYFLRYLDDGQKEDLGKLLQEHLEGGMPRDFELGAPEFCTFENMFKFERRFYLEKKEEEGETEGDVA